MAITIGTKVKGKLGMGIITKIITKSTGYVQVDYNGTLKNEMAFNLTDENGNDLKKKPVTETSGMSKGEKKRFKDAKGIAAFNAMPNLDKIKREIMGINGIVKGDRNSMHYQLISETLAGIWLKAKDKGDLKIQNIIDSIEKFMSATERQAWCVANFADQNNIKYKE